MGSDVAKWLRGAGVAGYVLEHGLARAEGSTYKVEVTRCRIRRAPSAWCAAAPGTGASIRRASACSGSPLEASWPRWTVPVTKAASQARPIRSTGNPPVPTFKSALFRYTSRHGHHEGYASGIPGLRLRRSAIDIGGPCELVSP